MHLKQNECVVKTFHHHSLTFFFRALKILAVSLPFFLVGFFISTSLDMAQTIILYSSIGIFFGALITYDLFFFYLDRLVVTNYRIIHVDWKGAFKRDEHEAELIDIQDIATEESGILSALPIFDFGLFRLQTASTKTTITFENAPDPEGIKHFIYHLNIKPTRIRAANPDAKLHDRTANTREEDSVSERAKV